MDDRDRQPNNPLGPYHPSELPDVPGNGRTWFALLVVTVVLLGAIGGLLSLLGF